MATKKKLIKRRPAKKTAKKTTRRPVSILKTASKNKAYKAAKKRAEAAKKRATQLYKKALAAAKKANKKKRC